VMRQQTAARRAPQARRGSKRDQLCNSSKTTRAGSFEGRSWSAWG
jgi:hypothetical protein